jgi:DNA-binding phage protein
MNFGPTGEGPTGPEGASWIQAASADVSVAPPLAQLPAQPPPDECPGGLLERLGMDGAAWACEFRATAQRLGLPPMDEGWLTSWFANAIMAGYDAATRKAEQRIVTIAAHDSKTLEQIESAALLEALEATGGNMSAAARRLGIDRRTLYRRVGSSKQFVLKTAHEYVAKCNGSE